MLIYSPPWLFQPILFSSSSLERGHNRKVTYSFGQYILNFSSWHCLVTQSKMNEKLICAWHVESLLAYGGVEFSSREPHLLE
ncbi:hypothetical protein P8452_28879 [Trifolium repens]|nr:hypothetical protein P8452_28879 [Trifolium repens]